MCLVGFLFLEGVGILEAVGIRLTFGIPDPVAPLPPPPWEADCVGPVVGLELEWTELAWCLGDTRDSTGVLLRGCGESFFPVRRTGVVLLGASPVRREAFDTGVKLLGVELLEPSCG